jgi:basic endochitinase B
MRILFYYSFLLLFLISYDRADARQKILKDASVKANITKYIDEEEWNALFPNRYHLPKEDFYSYKAFVQAAKKFPLFLNEGIVNDRKRELCAFLANIAQETNGGWAAAPGGYFKWGLYYMEEKGCEQGCPAYSDVNNKMYPPAVGKSYHGRGPKQLSWNYNYGQFSEAYYGNKDELLQNPELVATDAVVSFSSAIWFWMTTQAPKPSCHDIMVGKWTPTENDKQHGRVPGFGATVNVINGGIECGKQEAEKTKYRYEYYKYFCKYFNVQPGSNIECSTQQAFNK